MGAELAAGEHQEKRLPRSAPAPASHGTEGFRGAGTGVHQPSRQTWKSTGRAEGGDSSRKGKDTSETLLLKRKNIRAQLKAEALEPEVRMHPKSNTHTGSHQPHHSHWVPSKFH